MSRNPARLSEEKKENTGFEPKIRCEHYYCRCMLAAELASMDMLEAAIQVHFERVRCRIKGEE